jgi:hypothetical protein
MLIQDMRQTIRITNAIFAVFHKLLTEICCKAKRTTGTTLHITKKTSLIVFHCITDYIAPFEEGWK